MTQTIDHREVLFQEYWLRWGKQSADIFIECKTVPNEKSFEAMFRSAYMMGFDNAKYEGKP